MQAEYLAYNTWYLFRYIHVQILTTKSSYPTCISLSFILLTVQMYDNLAI